MSNKKNTKAVWTMLGGVTLSLALGAFSPSINTKIFAKTTNVSKHHKSKTDSHNYQQTDLARYLARHHKEKEMVMPVKISDTSDPGSATKTIYIVGTAQQLQQERTDLTAASQNNHYTWHSDTAVFNGADDGFNQIPAHVLLKANKMTDQFHFDFDNPVTAQQFAKQGSELLLQAHKANV